MSGPQRRAGLVVADLPDAVIVIALVTLVFALRAAVAAETPQAQYDAARLAMQKGQYAEAEAAFRTVADTAAAPTDLRAQALLSVGIMQQNQRRYAQALATFGDVGQRFPESPSARRAAAAAATLTEGGGAEGLEFRRRFDEAMDTVTKAQDRLDREGFGAAHAELERANAAMGGVLQDFADHPRRREVAFQLGEIRLALRSFGEALVAYQQALVSAGADQEGAGFVVNVMTRIEDTERARNRWWSTRAAWVVLALIAGAFLLARPWAGVDREMLGLGGRLAAGTFGLSVFAAALSYLVRTYIDDHSPVTEFVALLLVLLPGLTGVILTLGFLGRLPARAAGVLGALAALAVAICVVNFYELFPFLDSML